LIQSVALSSSPSETLLQDMLIDTSTIPASHFKDLAKDFNAGMQYGLALQGTPAQETNPFKMYDSGIPAAALDAQMVDGQTVLGIDVGGTAVKGAFYEVKDGKVYVATDANGDRVTAEESFGGRTTWNAAEFYGMLADFVTRRLGRHLAQQAGQGPIDALAYMYSFPGVATFGNNGQDVVSHDGLPKEWHIAGLEAGGPVGAQLIDALHQAGILVGETTTRVVPNDTTAMIDKDHQGLVLGTGANIAVNLQDLGIVNQECGGGDSKRLPKSNAMHIFDKGTTNFGGQQWEKVTAGYGVGGQMKVLIAEAVRRGLLPETLPGIFTDPSLLNRFMSELMTPGRTANDLPLISSARRVGVSDQGLTMLNRGAELILKASADAAASMVVAAGNLVRAYSPKFGGIVNFKTEGSFFWKTPGYKQNVAATIAVIDPSTNYNFVGKDYRLGLVGAAQQAARLNTYLNAQRASR